MKTLLLGALTTSVLIFFGAGALADDANGVMMVVKGDVKVTGKKDGKTDAAKVGRKVFQGDTIVAGPDSRAKIVMSDKNILNISPDSKMTIEQYSNNAANDSRNVELKVEYGKVRATVEQKYDGEKNKFNIKTPTAVAGVRGTDFITAFNASTHQSSIITFSGTVAVGTAGPNGSIKNPVFVRPGQTTNVGTAGAAEQPKAMPKEELSNMNKESSADTAKGGSTGGNSGSNSNSGGDKKSASNSSGSSSDSGSGSRSPASAGPGGGSMSPTNVDLGLGGPQGGPMPDPGPMPGPGGPGPGPRPLPQACPTCNLPPPPPAAVINSGKSRVSISINAPAH